MVTDEPLKIALIESGGSAPSGSAEPNSLLLDFGDADTQALTGQQFGSSGNIVMTIDQIGGSGFSGYVLPTGYTEFRVEYNGDTQQLDIYQTQQGSTAENTLLKSVTLAEPISPDAVRVNGGLMGNAQVYDMTLSSASPNTAPVADAGADQSVVAGDTVSFDGSTSSDVDGDSLTYSWDFDADGVEDATGATPTYTYANAGTYTVGLTVSDGTATATDSMTVTVGEANNPPVIDSGLDPATNITATVNESVSFDASNSTDADGDSLTYSWDFDADGVEDSANATATYTYDTAGTYNASLTVSDGTDSVSETYTVVVEESTDDGTTTTEEPTTEEPVGGGSGSDGLSTESILAIIGSFLFLVAVGVAVKRIA
jgi:PKD repeat protein